MEFHFMHITTQPSLMMTLICMLGSPPASATPLRAPAPSSESSSEAATKTDQATKADQAAKGDQATKVDPAPQDQKEPIEVQITSEVLSKSGDQLIELKVPFKYGLRRLKTPTTLKLDPSRDHIFSPVDDDCQSFEPFNLKLKTRLKEDVKQGPHRINLSVTPQKRQLKLSLFPAWGGEIKELSKFSVSVDDRPSQPLTKEPITVTSCTKEIKVTHPTASSVFISGPFKPDQELKYTVGYELQRKHRVYSQYRTAFWVITGISLLTLGITSYNSYSDRDRRIDYLFQATNPRDRAVAEDRLEASAPNEELLQFSAWSAVISGTIGYYYHSQIPDLEL